MNLSKHLALALLLTPLFLLSSLRAGEVLLAEDGKTEPLPKDSPLWAYENVYLSPHNSAISEPEAIAAYIAGQVLAFERGEALRNVVDRKRGY